MGGSKSVEAAVLRGRSVYLCFNREIADYSFFLLLPIFALK